MDKQKLDSSFQEVQKKHKSAILFSEARLFICNAETQISRNPSEDKEDMLHEMICEYSNNKESALALSTLVSTYFGILIFPNCHELDEDYDIINSLGVAWNDLPNCNKV